MENLSLGPLATWYKLDRGEKISASRPHCSTPQDTKHKISPSKAASSQKNRRKQADMTDGLAMDEKTDCQEQSSNWEGKGRRIVVHTMAMLFPFNKVSPRSVSVIPEAVTSLLSSKNNSHLLDQRISSIVGNDFF